MTAHDFSRPIKPTISYCFGIDPASSAAELRRLADRIENGEVFVRAARVLTAASRDEFASTTVRLSLHERIERVAPLVFGDSVTCAIMTSPHPFSGLCREASRA